MTKKCTQCGKEFLIPEGARSFKMCESCRHRSLNYDRKHRKKQFVTTRSEGLDAHLRELKEYNKANGTHLSYGKFMALREEELI